MYISRFSSRGSTCYEDQMHWSSAGSNQINKERDRARETRRGRHERRMKRRKRRWRRQPVAEGGSKCVLI
uniref:Uncharacterized protein n=1 Tax=Trichogramma kaykai TaxID=54128 RepID=A0ABD2W872_9HYME